LIQAKVIQMWQALSQRERKEIRRRSVRASDGVMRCRCKIILNLVRGKTPTMIAHGGLCAKSQVYRVADRFIERGLVGLADRREDNGETKATDAYGMEVLLLIEGSPQEHGYRRPTWTQELLVLVVAERTGVRVSITTMCRLLPRLGVRLNRPKPTVSCPWTKSRRTRRLREIQRLIDNLATGEVVLYLDEVDIHLNPKIGPDWTLAGKQKYVHTPGCNEKRYLAGALNPKTGKITWVEGDRKNSLLFLDLLYRLVTVTYRSARRVHLILDNYGIHDSQQVRLALKSDAARRIKLHFLPPYCPDHNRIERTWKDLHDNVTRNHRCTGMEELMKDVRLYLNARNKCGRHTYARDGAA
jgi:transposase